MIAGFTKWDNSVSGTLGAGPMGVPLSEVLLYVERRGFKLDSVKSVKTTILPGDFGTSLDLKDAYHHISVLPEHRCFLRFLYKGEH